MDTSGRVVMSTEIIISLAVLVPMLGYGLYELYCNWWKIKTDIPLLFVEVRQIWKNSSKVEKVATLVFLLSIPCAVYPSELISRIGYMLQSLFWALFIFIVARKGSNIDDK